jgi:hypothetical protein
MVTLDILGGTVAIGCFKPEAPGAAVPCKEIPASHPRIFLRTTSGFSDVYKGHGNPNVGQPFQADVRLESLTYQALLP